MLIVNGDISKGIVVIALFVTLLGTVGVWLMRATRGRYLGVAWTDMSVWRAIGDFSIVFILFFILANLIDCIDFLHRGWLIGFVSLTFSYQIFPIPLGAVLAVVACVEAPKRLACGTSGIV
jgi:hypothetical protein